MAYTKSFFTLPKEVRLSEYTKLGLLPGPIEVGSVESVDLLYLMQRNPELHAEHTSLFLQRDGTDTETIPGICIVLGRDSNNNSNGIHNSDENTSYTSSIANNSREPLLNCTSISQWLDEAGPEIVSRITRLRIIPDETKPWTGFDISLPREGDKETPNLSVGLYHESPDKPKSRCRYCFCHCSGPNDKSTTHSFLDRDFYMHILEGFTHCHRCSGVVSVDERDDTPVLISTLTQQRDTQGKERDQWPTKGLRADLWNQYSALQSAVQHLRAPLTSVAIFKLLALAYGPTDAHFTNPYELYRRNLHIRAARAEEVKAGIKYVFLGDVEERVRRCGRFEDQEDFDTQFDCAMRVVVRDERDRSRISAEMEREMVRAW